MHDRPSPRPPQLGCRADELCDNDPVAPDQQRSQCDRRAFLRLGAAFAVGAPLAAGWTRAFGGPAVLAPEARSRAAVAIVSCKTYGPEVKPALRQCFDLLGGVEKLVRNKTVTIKLNLTGTNFTWFLGRPVGETYMTHSATVMALLALLFDSGAARVRLAESTESHADLQTSLDSAGWDVKALSALGKVEYENTRNLGAAKSYSTLRVPFGGYMFSSFDLNHSYHDTDVMVSLAKLKRHLTAGVTLSMKNCFGLTPTSLYGAEAGRESATEGRVPLHDPAGFEHLKLPGLKPGVPYRDPFSRVPRIVVDVCAARPIDLAIVDGISAMTGGEGPWCGQASVIKPTNPGVLIAGRNAVSTDAVATAVMGYDPRAARGTRPFEYCDNFLLLAESAGLGSADLGQIDARGVAIGKARYPYD
jgi:uncharacterized protein (DUF362 family)